MPSNTCLVIVDWGCTLPRDIILVTLSLFLLPGAGKFKVTATDSTLSLVEICFKEPDELSLVR